MCCFGAHVHSNVFRRPIRAQRPIMVLCQNTRPITIYTPQSATSVVWKDPFSCIYALIAVILNAPEGHASAITSKNFGITRQLKPI